jgi:short-subunit dehydrogenase
MKLLFFPSLWFNAPRERSQRDKLLQKLAGKTVLITGASYGIGACLAEMLAAPDIHLILIARSTAKLIEMQQRIESRGGRADIFACDLRNVAEVDVLLATLHQLPNGIDIFVNNAGKSIRRSIFDSLDRLHDFTRTMNLNYFAPVQLILALIPMLVERQGHIINISALNVLLIPAPKWAAYQASKTAFDQWFRSVGIELSARGVRTTSIYLPLVRTRMIEPTKMYRNMPAMQPEDAAKLICNAIITRRRTYAPWWSLWGQLASILWRWPLEVAMSQRSK